VEEKISKTRSRKASLKKQQENLVQRIEMTKNISSGRSSRTLVQLQNMLNTCEDDIQIIGSSTSELEAHHQSLVKERESQESRHYDLLETVMSIHNIVRDAKNRHTTLSRDLGAQQRQRNKLETKLSNQHSLLASLKIKIEKISDDKSAVKNALDQLNQRKSSLIAVFVKIMKQELEVNTQLNALQKSHKILGEKIWNISEDRNQLENKGASDFKDYTVKVMRQDSDRKCPGTLTVSRSNLKFVPSYIVRDDLYRLNLPLTHVLAAQMNNLRNVPELTLTLNPEIETYASHELRFTKETKTLLTICEFLNSRYAYSNIEERDIKPELAVTDILPHQDIEIEIIGESTILNDSAFKKLILKCPKQVMFFPWKLQYSLEKHGSSMYAFYERLKGCQFTILLIKDTMNSVFGAYLCEEWHKCDENYGKLETFVFKETDNDVKVWKSTEEESFYQFSNENIFIGIKDRSAIWLSSNFLNGRTHQCPTFASPKLTKDNESTADFQVLFLEVWTPSYDF